MTNTWNGQAGNFGGNSLCSLTHNRFKALETDEDDEEVPAVPKPVGCTMGEMIEMAKQRANNRKRKTQAHTEAPGGIPGRNEDTEGTEE